MKYTDFREFNSGYGGAVTLEGPATIAAANAIREKRAQKTEWPYPWIFPPPGAIRVTAGADASGTTAVVAGPAQGLEYTVDEGFNFALEKLVVMYIGGAVNPGDFLWSLTVNQALGVPNFMGQPVQGFTNVDVPLGTLQIPWPLEMPEVYEPNDAIRVILTNVNLSGGFWKCILLGWRWPVSVF